MLNTARASHDLCALKTHVPKVCILTATSSGPKALPTAVGTDHKLNQIEPLVLAEPEAWWVLLSLRADQSDQSHLGILTSAVHVWQG
jgi:hypothetical protein